jgi:hypothetical protein
MKVKTIVILAAAAATVTAFAAPPSFAQSTQAPAGVNSRLRRFGRRSGCGRLS